MTQYVMKYFQLMFSRPIGLMNVVAKPAPLPKNWNSDMPRDRSANGQISTR